jgi:hypothetical protein
MAVGQKIALGRIHARRIVTALTKSARICGLSMSPPWLSGEPWAHIASGPYRERASSLPGLKPEMTSTRPAEKPLAARWIPISA